MTPKTKIKAFRAYFRAYFPLQLQNLDNNTFSSCKNHQCIPAETFENLCTKRKMAKYRQKWGRIQKNRRHRMGQHHSKTNIEMVWESNQSRWINTSVEGVYLRQHPYQRPRLKPTWTWLSIIKSDFRNLNLTWDEAINTAIDLITW